MTDFLLELRSEEIPARMQVKAQEDLTRLFADEIAKAGLTATAVETFATPRRLALIARGLPQATAAVSEERKGPRSNAPEAALAGFLRSTGLTREQLVERDGVFFAVIDKPGRPTAAVLAEAVPAVVRAFPWPKSMRWGAPSLSTESLRWVRPLQGIVALFGDDVVPFEIDGIESGAATVGHRFHHGGPITIGSAADYAEKLRACHVIVSLSERMTLIRDGARAAAEGLVLVEDEGLVVENAGLTEWPVPLLGRFDAAFLDVPREVIQLTMRTNQKYFACVEPSSAALSLSKGGPQEPGFDKLTPAETLANAFVCTANIDASDGGTAIVAGNRKVLAARLSDAKFFWENDLKVRLATQAEKLSQIVFHEKLGTVADKVDRVVKLARWLVEEGIVHSSFFPERRRGALPSEAEARDKQSEVLDFARTSPSSPLGKAELADLAEQAARLCKADLVTGMVGEFPELQGIIGGHLARAQGLPDAVADAIRDHYKPVGQGDDVPTAPVTVAVSLADKLDTLIGFFGIGEVPTGSRDPFALRRAALGVIAIATTHNMRIPLAKLLSFVVPGFVFPFVNRIARTLADADAAALIRAGNNPHALNSPEYQARLRSHPTIANFANTFAESGGPLMAFFADRLKVQQREAGVRHDLIDAVFALGGEDDLVRLLARVKALQTFVGTADGTNLLAGYKRAANILKKEGVASTSTRHPELVSGSTPPPEKPSQAERWTPDQVRGDGIQMEEAALITALDTAEPLAAAAIAAENFEAAMTALSALRTPIDAFFENVTVNDPDADKRAARLALLARFRDAVHRVADFSKIEG